MLRRVTPGLRARLAERGWIDEQIIALIRDWPKVTFDGVEFLLATAMRFPAPATPVSAEQVRGWLRLAFETESAIDDPTWALGARGWEVSDLAVIAEQFTFAAGGDGDLARLAFLAGLGPDELAGQVSTGQPDRAGLQTLAELRKQPPASRGRVPGDVGGRGTHDTVMTVGLPASPRTLTGIGGSHFTRRWVRFGPVR